MEVYSVPEPSSLAEEMSKPPLIDRQSSLDSVGMARRHSPAAIRRLARGVIRGIPAELLMVLLQQAKSSLAMVEEACLAASVDEDDFGDAISVSSESAASSRSSRSDDSMLLMSPGEWLSGADISPSTCHTPEHEARAMDERMVRMLMTLLPREVSRGIAKEVQTRLLRVLSQSLPLEDVISDDIMEEMAASGSSDVETMMAELAARELLSASTVAESAQWSSRMGSISSRDDASPRSPEDAISLTASPSDGDEENCYTGAHHARVMAAEKARRDTQMADFRKFKMVLTAGHGIRVVKHNHNGGKRNRVLRYNPSNNCLFWQSSRLIGGERIQCNRIVRVQREEKVVYVWHMGTGLHGSQKKMVGFETQREADAIILENALLYLKDTQKTVPNPGQSLSPPVA
jgi:hypothetical protein